MLGSALSYWYRLLTVLEHFPRSSLVLQIHPSNDETRRNLPINQPTMRIGPTDPGVYGVDPTRYPPDPFPGKPVFALFTVIADVLSLAPNAARQKTVWEHYNEIARYIDFEREREWGDVADSTLVFVSEFTLNVQYDAYTLIDRFVCRLPLCLSPRKPANAPAKHPRSHPRCARSYVSPTQ